MHAYPEAETVHRSHVWPEGSWWSSRHWTTEPSLLAGRDLKHKHWSSLHRPACVFNEELKHPSSFSPSERPKYNSTQKALSVATTLSSQAKAKQNNDWWIPNKTCIINKGANPQLKSVCTVCVCEMCVFVHLAHSYAWTLVDVLPYVLVLVKTADNIFHLDVHYVHSALWAVGLALYKFPLLLLLNQMRWLKLHSSQHWDSNHHTFHQQTQHHMAARCKTWGNVMTGGGA